MYKNLFTICTKTYLHYLQKPIYNIYKNLFTLFTKNLFTLFTKNLFTLFTLFTKNLFTIYTKTYLHYVQKTYLQKIIIFIQNH
jgi:hypothetical protein